MPCTRHTLAFENAIRLVAPSIIAFARHPVVGLGAGRADMAVDQPIAFLARPSVNGLARRLT